MAVNMYIDTLEFKNWFDANIGHLYTPKFPILTIYKFNKWMNFIPQQFTVKCILSSYLINEKLIQISNNIMFY